MVCQWGVSYKSEQGKRYQWLFFPFTCCKNDLNLYSSSARVWFDGNLHSVYQNSTFSLRTLAVQWIVKALQLSRLRPACCHHRRYFLHHYPLKRDLYTFDQFYPCFYFNFFFLRYFFFRFLHRALSTIPICWFFVMPFFWMLLFAHSSIMISMHRCIVHVARCYKWLHI